VRSAMTHDQKPGRVRVVEPGGGATPQRRRHDAPPVVIDGRAKPSPRRSGKIRVLLALLFLVAAAAGGVATAWAGLA